MTFEQILGSVIGITMLAAFAYILWQWRRRQKDYENIERNVRFYDGR